ncbi:MAG TPA: AzlD domain-containing protein [Xanthobacteraceae bacterium]|nr:AzlD domain-containing protein [Xanthobacteraceae bacterium]
MTTDSAIWSSLIAVLAMALATYPMRAGGFWLMGRVPLTPRVRRILEALPGAVVMATVVPILAREGVAALAAILAALAVTLVRRNEFLALAAGVAAGAAARAAGFG